MLHADLLTDGLMVSTGTEDDTDWFTDEGGTPSTGTGPTVDFNPGTSAGNYIYVEASGCFSQDANLITPCIDLTSATLPQLSFRYHMLGINMGTLHVDVFDGTSWTLDVMTPISGNQGSNWNLATVNLSAFNGNTINIRFRGETGTSYESDIAIDDVQVMEVAAPPVAGFTSSHSTVCVNGTAQMTDQSTNIPTSWSWTVTPGTHNFTGGTSSSSQNPIIQFTAAGTYDIKLITTNAFGTDSVTITAIINATTGTTLPVSEDFEAPVFPPAGGWSIDNPDGGTTWQHSGSVTGSSGTATLATWVNNFSYNAPGQEDGITSMILDLSGIINPLLTFDVAYAPYSATLFESLRVDVSTDCGDSFTPTSYLKSGTTLATVPAQTGTFTPSDAGHWRRDSVDLTAYTGSTVIVRIININGYGNSLYLDNINIKESFCFPPSLSSSVTNALCNGGSEGGIDLTVTGGTAPYSYSWSNGSSTEDLSGLSAGVYTVMVTDAEGCTASRVDQVNEPAPIAVTSSKGNVTCNGQDNGTARVVASGGTQPYQYLWDTSPTQTTDQISNLAGGNYNCIITDVNGCTNSVDVSIFNPSPVVVFSIPNNPNVGDINLLVSRWYCTLCIQLEHRSIN